MVCILKTEVPHRNLRVSFWFDGNIYHPLVEDLDTSRNAVAGKLLRSNFRLIDAILHAKSWVDRNRPLSPTEIN